MSIKKSKFNLRTEEVVKYKNKLWNVADLLEHLVAVIRELEKNQCKPNASCLFEYRRYADRLALKTIEKEF